MTPKETTTRHLLAVDLGLRTGLALYGPQGRLIWYRSHNFGSAARLKKAAGRILGEIPSLQWLVIEGGGTLAGPWQREAQRRQITILQISAEQWRQRFLLPREQRSGIDAKSNADELARQVITWSGARRPTSLRHDAAEAVLIGLFGVLRVGWLESLPEALRRR